jgi:glutaredoxin-like protein NrdH
MAKQCTCTFTKNEDKTCDGSHKKVVNVYTNENCIQCDRTKKFLDDNNIPYKTISLADNMDDAKKFVEMGFRSAPIVETKNEVWSGFKLDKLKSLIMEDNK